MADRVGQHVGNYRLVSLLGQGGFAEVYLGQHVRLNLQAAIKVLYTHLTEKEVEHFQQEAQTIATLMHPSIVRIMDFDVQDGVPFLVMEYAPNGSLRRRYPKGSVVPLSQIVSLVKQVAAALQYAHEQQFIHRDVKPENLLLGRQQEVLLTDFGLAALTHSSVSLSTQAAVGTLPYMAPEQIEGHPRAASDQYAMGVMVYEWLCGQRPFEGSFTEVMVQHLTRPPPALQAHLPTISPAVEHVVLRALAKDPKNRFASVAAFADALEQAAVHGRGQALPSSQPGRFPSEQPSPGPAAVQSYATDVVAPSHMADLTQVDSSSDQLAVPMPPDTTVGGLERRLVTVLFCGLAEFTPLSEQLDPEDIHDIQVLHFEQMSQEIKRFGGSFEQYYGDSVLALFGVPVAHEDDAVRAVRCGLSMQAAIKHVAAEGRKRWGVELALRVGVNTGEVVSGTWDIGGRKDHAVSGDVVHTAVRLQEAAAPGEVFVGEETMWLARKAIRFGERRAVTLKGKAGVVPAYAAMEVEEQAVEIWHHLPLVGRTNELALLTGIRAKVVQECHPHLVTVLGEPGIGKSRLVAEFEDSLNNEALVLHGRCLSYGEGRGYWALAEVVREAAGITLNDDMETATGKLGKLVAGALSQTEAEWDPREITAHLAMLSGLDVESDRPAQLADQRTLYMSVSRFLEALARCQPLCLLFEDLHWADEALLDLIEFSAARIREVPLLLLTQARPELLEKRPSWGRSLRNFTSLALEPLNEQHGRTLALLLCQERGLAVNVAEQVAQGAAGNPLFAEEIVATIAEKGGTTGIPTAIKSLIAARLDTLPPQQRRAMQLAAVIGKVFWEGGLRALGAAGDMTEQLEALEQKDLLRSHPRSQMRGDREYAFKHDLIRDVVYEMLSRADRRVLHQRLVGWIEVISGERVEEYLDLLAHHAFEAGLWTKALEYAQRAGEKAQRLYAPRAATLHYTWALDAARQLSLAPPASLYRARGLAYEALGDFERARADQETALEHAHDTSDDHAEWQALLDLGFLWAGRAYAQAGDYYQQALALARTMDDPATLAHSLNRLGNWYLNVEQPQEALRCHQEALATFQALSDQRGKALTLDLLGVASLLSGDLVQSAAYYEQAIALLRELDERKRLPNSLATLMLCGGNYQTETLVPAAGGFAGSLQQGELALKIAGEIGQRSDEAYTLIHMAMCLGPRGEYARALEVAQRGLGIAEEIEHRQWVTAGHRALGALYLDLLALSEAQQHLEQALALAQEVGSRHLARIASGFLALVSLAQHDVTRAESLLNAALGPDDPTQTVGQRMVWYARAELALARNDPLLALHITDQLLASAVGLSSESSIPALAKLRGEALIKLKQAAEAETILQQARVTALGRGLRPLLWRISLTQGKLAHSQRRYEEADRRFAEALETLEDLASSLPDQVLQRHLLRHAHALFPRTRQPSPDRLAKKTFAGLTHREREVARLVAQGKADREIADILAVNSRTIEKHIENILSKLSFASRAQIAVWASEKGLGKKEQR